MRLSLLAPTIAFVASRAATLPCHLLCYPLLASTSSFVHSRTPPSLPPRPCPFVPTDTHRARLQPIHTLIASLLLKLRPRLRFRLDATRLSLTHLPCLVTLLPPSRLVLALYTLLQFGSFGSLLALSSHSVHPPFFASKSDTKGETLLTVSAPGPFLRRRGIEQRVSAPCSQAICARHRSHAKGTRAARSHATGLSRRTCGAVPLAPFALMRPGSRLLSEKTIV